MSPSNVLNATVDAFSLIDDRILTKLDGYYYLMRLLISELDVVPDLAFLVILQIFVINPILGIRIMLVTYDTIDMYNALLVSIIDLLCIELG
jgi:hypothetical protein